MQYKAVNNLIPEYISDLIPHFARDVRNYSLRNNNNIRVPFIRTEISLWNSLDKEIRASSSLLCFKNKIKNLRTDCNNVPHFFLCGERYWSVLQARIRKNCSNLNHDLYINHLCNSPACSCGFIMEDADHFFFNCPNYPNAHIALFNASQIYHPLNVEKLLFGYDNLTVQENTTIFIAV